MTDQSEFERQTLESGKHQAAGTMAVTRQPGPSANAIAAGLEFLFSGRHSTYWGLAASSGESTPWITAYVLARLGEVPAHYITHSQRRKIEASLDWLLEIRTPQGGWGFSQAASGDDADSTAWAVTALRQHGRPVPEDALALIQRCRRADGGFAFYPESASVGEFSSSSAPDVTAIAVRALMSIDAVSSEFLAANLRTDALARPCRLASKFFVSSTLLDWEPEIAPWLAVNAVRQLARQYSGDSAWELGLLLRCAMRLRMQSSWALAAGLRRRQQADGSWPGSAVFAPLSAGSAQQESLCFDDEGILATATTVSALAMGDLQPGLYFGSDLPFRRL